MAMLVVGVLPGLFTACGSSSGVGANGSTSLHRVAQITATAKPGVPYGPLGNVDHQTQTLEYLQYQLNRRFGRMDASYGYSAASDGAMDFHFHGTKSEVQSFADALRSSGLVASIMVSYRNTPDVGSEPSTLGG